MPELKIPGVKTPLGIIAMFVALIELFLAYPVTQLQGYDRTILIVFMVLFPTYVSTAFFYILWHKPIHLYSPQDITPGLENRFQPEVTRLIDEVKIISGEVKRLESEKAQLESTAANTPIPEATPDADIAARIDALDLQIRGLREEQVSKVDEIAHDFSYMMWTSKASLELKAHGIDRSELQRSLAIPAISMATGTGQYMYEVEINGHRVSVWVDMGKSPPLVTAVHVDPRKSGVAFSLSK